MEEGREPSPELLEARGVPSDEELGIKIPTLELPDDDPPPHDTASTKLDAPDANWHIKEDAGGDLFLVLDPTEISAPYFHIRYLDMAGDNSSVEFVHKGFFSNEVTEEIDRIALYRHGPYGDHGEAIRQKIKQQGLPNLDVPIPGIDFVPSNDIYSKYSRKSRLNACYIFLLASVIFLVLSFTTNFFGIFISIAGIFNLLGVNFMFFAYIPESAGPFRYFLIFNVAMINILCLFWTFKFTLF